MRRAGFRLPRRLVRNQPVESEFGKPRPKLVNSHLASLVQVVKTSFNLLEESEMGAGPILFGRFVVAFVFLIHGIT